MLVMRRPFADILIIALIGCGTEVIVWRSRANYLASFRHSEGVPGRKSIVPLLVRGDTIEFTIPPDSGIRVHGSVRQPTETNPARKFTGRVTPCGLRGVVEDWTDSLTLPRKEKPYFPDSIRPINQAR